jgi:hypothetical protein
MAFPFPSLCALAPQRSNRTHARTEEERHG